MKERQSGYYWVVLSGSEVWTICQWDAVYRFWWSFGSEEAFEETDFDEINETKIIEP